MGPLEAIKSGVLNTMQMSQRTTRPEFWWFALAALSLMLIVVVLTTPKPNVIANTSGFVPLNAERQHVTVRLSALPLAGIVATLLIGLSLLTASIRRFNDVGWSRWLSLPFLVLTIALCTAFLTGAADNAQFVLSSMLYNAIIDADTPLTETYFILFMLSPLFFATLIADVLFITLGAVLLTAAAALTSLTAIICLSLNSTSANPNEAPS